MKPSAPLVLFALVSAALSAAAQSSYPLEGGTRTFLGNDIVHAFTNSGTLVVSAETTVRALFVAGGGGGGTGVGGGGGGGGVVQVGSLTLAPGTYEITVGAGGATAAKGGDTTMTLGGEPVVDALPAIGGGAGHGWSGKGGDGGSGGGSCGGSAGGAGTPGQGFDGGRSYARSSSGGGGAGGPGGDGGNATPRSPSAVGGVGVTNDISGVAVAYGGGGGGGGGDNGATPPSPGTDGGGDATGFNTGLPGGDGADGRGGGGGGSGWGSTVKPGGRGGSGIAILRYTFDLSMLPEPTVTASPAEPGVKSATVAIRISSFGRNASSLSVVATATPADGGDVVSKTFSFRTTGDKTLELGGLRSDVLHSISLVAANDQGRSVTLDAGTVLPVSKWGKASGGEESFAGRHRTVHVFTNETDALVVERGTFADVLLVGGGGAGGTSVGGGGGGGGAVYRTRVPLVAGIHAVSVGRGGTQNGSKNGGDTAFAGFVAFGGGGGGGWGPTAGNPGGSGGGSCGGFAGGTGTPGQGFDGGLSGVRSSSGGGGAGGPGGDGGTSTPRSPSAVGGIGFACSITGTEVRYGGGGGGGGGDNGQTPASPGTDGGGDGTAFNSGLPGGDGADGLGAGGGGSGYATSVSIGAGGRGGCGVVIVAYDLPPTGTVILVK